MQESRIIGDSIRLLTEKGFSTSSLASLFSSFVWSKTQTQKPDAFDAQNTAYNDMLKSIWMYMFLMTILGIPPTSIWCLGVEEIRSWCGRLLRWR